MPFLAHWLKKISISAVVPDLARAASELPLVAKYATKPLAWDLANTCSRSSAGLLAIHNTAPAATIATISQNVDLNIPNSITFCANINK